MTTEQDRATVREHYPHARAVAFCGGFTIFGLRVGCYLGTGPSEHAAWADAAGRIREMESEAAK